MLPRTLRWIGVALATAGAAAAADGQDLDLPRTDGPVRLVYPAAASVCGTGDGILIREPDGSTMFVSGRGHTGDGWRTGDPPCRTGVAVVRMTRADGRWTDVRVTVGEPARQPAAMGPDVAERSGSGQAAADLLLRAARSAGDHAARDLLLAAAIAGDAVVWPGLLDLARDRSLPSGVRQSAIHWLGRDAAREAVTALGGIVRDRTEDDRVREAAVFALSRLPEDQGVPLLIELVRTSDDPRVVKHALFWLADSEDPRALAVFEEILAGR